MKSSVAAPTRKPSPAESHIDSRKILSDVQAEPAFEAEQQTYGRALAIGRAAGRLLEIEQTLTEDKETSLHHLYEIISKVPGFVEGDGMMQRHTPKHRLPREEVKKAKTLLVDFNHALKQLLDADPTLSPTEVTEFLTTVYQEMHDSAEPEQIEHFRLHAEIKLRGMQHEVFAKNIIDSLAPEFTADGDVSIQDDLRGVDIFVTYNGVRFPVDIKASSFTARNAQRHSSKPKHIIWSGIEAKRTKDRFRLTTDEINRTQGYMRRVLLEAYHEYIGRAKNIGKSVLASPEMVPKPELGGQGERQPAMFEGVVGVLSRELPRVDELLSSEAETAASQSETIFYERIYPIFQRYLSSLSGDVSPLQIRNQICEEYAKVKGKKINELKRVREFLDKLIREYQIREFLSMKNPKLVVPVQSYELGYDVEWKGKKMPIQGGFRSLVSGRPSGGYAPEFHGDVKKQLRPWK